MLVVAAAPFSVAVAWTFLALLRGALPPRIVRFVPGWTAMTVDPRLIAVTLVIAAITMIVFGLLPALQFSRSDVARLRPQGPADVEARASAIEVSR